MRAFLLRPEFWVAFFLLVFFLSVVAWRLRLRWKAAWLLRVLLAGTILLALFAAIYEPNRKELPLREVLVVDQSDSLSVEARQAAIQSAPAWQGAAPNRLVIAFGAGPLPLVPAEIGKDGIPLTGVDGSKPLVDGRASDLAGALKLANQMLADSPGKIILATDGLALQPELVTAEAGALARQGTELEILPLPSRSTQNDLAVSGLSAPKNLWAGTRFDLLARVEGAAGTQVDLQLKINGQSAPFPAEPLAAGLYRFQIPPLPQGMATLQVTANAGAAVSPDPFPGNNAAYTVVQVFAPPRVQLVTSQLGSAPVAGLVQLLNDSGVQVDAVAPDGLPTNLDTLQKYQVVILDNLLANQLTREQMTALQVFVSRLAGGLVVMGGRNSYTLGAYQGTPLEAMLPVRLETPPRSMRPAIVFQLVLDHSSSMDDMRAADPLSPMAMAREAAMRSIETLRSEDYLGVLTFSDESTWNVPTGPIGSPEGLKQALDAVNQVRAGGSTYMYQALLDALGSVAALPVEAPTSRHVLLLSDGQSTDGSDEAFRLLAAAGQKAGITISTIALGSSADAKLMAQIAELGKGHFYAVKKAKDLPRILVSESQAMRSENVQSGLTSLKVGEEGHAILSGLSPNQLPQISGYNALRSKRDQGAEDVLVSSSFDDPILSSWQYGLGRVIAWTSDLGEEWAGSWPGEGGIAAAGTFWSQVVRYALVNPGLKPAQVDVQVSADRLVVDASISTPSSEPVNLASPTFTYIDAANQTHSYRLAQVSPGAYQLEIPRPADGAYRAVFAYPGADGQKIEIPAPFAVNPPEEWLPPDPAASQANLAAWARAAGGETTTLSEILQPVQADGDGEPKKIIRGLDDLWWRILLALILFWPLEIAIRKRWLPWK